MLRLAALTALAAALLVGPARAETTCAAPIQVGPDRYEVRVEQGRITCAAARRALRSYILTFERRPGWSCFRGHGSDAWAAACARGHVVVRAYPVD